MPELKEAASGDKSRRPFEKLSDEELMQRYIAERVAFTKSEAEKNKLFSRNMAAVNRLIADPKGAGTRKEYDAAMAEISRADLELKTNEKVRREEGDALFDELTKRSGWPDNFEEAQKRVDKQLEELSESDPEIAEWAMGGFNAHRLEQFNELCTRQEELVKEIEDLKKRSTELNKRYQKTVKEWKDSLGELRLASVKADIGTEQGGRDWEVALDTTKKRAKEFKEFKKDYRQFTKDWDGHFEKMRSLAAEFQSLRGLH